MQTLTTPPTALPVRARRPAAPTLPRHSLPVIDLDVVDRPDIDHVCALILYFTDSHDLRTATKEGVLNALLHGGGKCRVRLWLTPDCCRVEVADEGAGIDWERVRTKRSDDFTQYGRGMEIMRGLVETHIRNTPEGVTVTLAVRR